MHGRMIAPLCTALALAACGGGAEEEAADASLDAAEITERASQVQTMRPGQYRSTTEILELEMPGLPEAMREQMAAATRAAMAQETTFCLTPQQSEAGERGLVENLAQSQCTMTAFETSASSVEAAMRCEGGEGMTGTIRMEGTVAAEGSTMLLDMDQQVPGTGAMQMRMRVVSERVGDCP